MISGETDIARLCLIDVLPAQKAARCASAIVTTTSQWPDREKLVARTILGPPAPMTVT